MQFAAEFRVLIFMRGVHKGSEHCNLILSTFITFNFVFNFSPALLVQCIDVCFMIVTSVADQNEPNQVYVL